MPKRELSKCREWERERRERLKTCFDALARLLPSHDPTINPSKLEILQRAATHITDLQQKNKELLLGDQKSTAVAQRDEVRRLRERVKKLNARSEQLANLMKTAGLKLPKEYIGASRVFKGPPKLWSGRLSREKAESLRKQHEHGSGNELKPDDSRKSLKRKRIPSVSIQNKKSTENTPPPVKKPLKQSQNAKKSSKKTKISSLASKVATVLGPGTLILANGNVVPVPAPIGTPATLHRIQLVPTVNQSNPQVILMSQQNNIAKSVTTSSKLPVIRPKMSANLKQNIVAPKIPIPALPKRKICAKKVKNSSKTITSNNTEGNSSVIAVNNDKENTKSTKNEPIIENKDITNAKSELIVKQNETETPESNTANNNTKDNPKTESEVLKIDSKPKNDEKQSSDTIPEPNLTQTDPKPQNITLETIQDPKIIEEEPNQLLQVIQNDSDHLTHPGDHSELSNDIFASLGGPGDSSGVIGGQHTESMSPTAAFLLAFPLVSTLTGSRISDTQNGISGTGNGGNSMINNAGSGSNNNERNEQNNSEDDRQSTPTTLLQIGGTMNLDNTNKPNSRTVLQIGDPINIDNNKNSTSVLHQIDLDASRQSKNVLQQINIDTNLKQNRNNNYTYFRESQNYSNQQINTTNSCLNTRDNNNSFDNNKEPLISSVLQVSHACLYEQRNTQNNFYPHSFAPESTPQNYTNCQNKETAKTSSKNRIKNQNQRPPVNWMTTPDIRPTFPSNESTTSGMTSDYFLPPFSDVYSGISSAINDLSHQNNNNADQSFAWTSGTNRNVLPTLLGDLALGVTAVNSISTTSTTASAIYTNTSSINSKTTVSSNTNQYYHPFEAGTNSAQIQTAQMPQSNQQNPSMKESGGFLSVSSILVGGKPRKNQQQSQHTQHNNSKRHREKQNKTRTSTNNIPETNTNMSSYGTNEGQNGHKKYGGGYSAEELIGEPQYHENRSYLNNDQLYQNRSQNQAVQNHQNNPQNHQSSSRQNQGYQQRQQGPQQQQGPFGASYPPHGEFSALLSAAVVDTYSKTFDSFVHVKPPNGGPVGPPVSATGFDSYCTTTRNETHHRTAPPDSERRRHSRRSGAPTTSRDTLAPTAATNTGTGFTELSFLSMTGAVNSPVLPDDFHGSAPFLTNAPPPIPTPVASSLTNFNLSAIFPEIHKGAAASSAPMWPHSKPPVSSTRAQTRYQHQNQQIHTNHHEHQTVHQHGALPGVAKAPGGYCHPQQHTHGQHEGLYPAVAPSLGFPGNISHHQASNTDVTTAPTNFSFSFSTP